METLAKYFRAAVLVATLGAIAGIAADAAAWVSGDRRTVRYRIINRTDQKIDFSMFYSYHDSQTNSVKKTTLFFKLKPRATKVVDYKLIPRFRIRDCQVNMTAHIFFGREPISPRNSSSTGGVYLCTLKSVVLTQGVTRSRVNFRFYYH